jgi:hypothetical protein
MVRLSSISSFKRYPPLQAIGWFILFVLILEVTCRAWLPESGMENEFQAISKLAETAPAPTIEIMGDSVAAGGVLTTLLTQDSNTIGNYAVTGSGPAFSYFLLKRELAAGHAPAYVLIVHSPHTFSGVRFPVLVGSFARWSELPELFWNSDDGSAFLYGLLARLSYILTYRDQFKLLLTEGNYQFFLDRPVPRAPETQRLAEYRALEKTNAFKANPLPDEIWDMYKEPFRVSRLNDRFFRKMLQMAKANGIKVFWVSLPETRRVFDYRKKIGYTEDQFRYLDQFYATGELKFLQRDILVYEDDLFDDLSHLNMRGAIRFSSHLSRIWPAILPH